MALQLTAHHEEEVLRARASLALGDPDRLTRYDARRTGQRRGGAGGFRVALRRAPAPVCRRRNRAAPPAASQPLGRGRAGASNVFAAAPSRSAAGGAILANDPHLALTAPTIWYLARLELSTGGVIGATIPGMPDHPCRPVRPAGLGHHHGLSRRHRPLYRAAEPRQPRGIPHARRLGALRDAARDHRDRRRRARDHHPARDGKRPRHPRQSFQLFHRHPAGACHEHVLDRADRGQNTSIQTGLKLMRAGPSRKRWRRARISWRPPRTSWWPVPTAASRCR
jgi:hypothetical protein